MMMHKEMEENLLPQGDRTSRDGRGGAIVPGPLPSSSNDGPTSSCTAGLLAETTSAKTQAEANERAGLPVVLLPPIGKETMNKPGPAFTKTTGSGPRTSSGSRSGSRSRSSSVASVTSVKSSAAMEVERTRKAQRELEMNVRRCMEKAAVARANSCEDMGEFSEVDVESVSDEEEHREERDSGSDIEWVDAQETDRNDGKRKRKRKYQHALSVPPKRGRPPTTREYMGLAEAKKTLNEQKKIEAMLDWEKKINAMSPAELLTNMGIDIDDAVEDMKQNPTADVANRARESMVEVLKVAKKSKNLYGLCVKDLKLAAIRGAVALEVLRSRADNVSDNDIPRQHKALREELERVKKEAQSAREEVDKLRKRLAKEKESKKRNTRSTRVIDSDSNSSSSAGTPERRSAGKERKKTPSTRKKSEETKARIDHSITEDVEMVEVPPVEEEVTPPSPKYCDERRKREIFPPRTVASSVRPALQGKVKVLEHIPLVGHKVRLVDGKTEKKKVEPSPVPGVAVEEKGGAQLLLEQITPLLQKWLEESLKSMGLFKKPSGRDASTANAKCQPGAGPKAIQKAEKPTRPQVKGPEGAKKEVVQSTTVPNAALWSKVVGRKTGKEASPLLPVGQQQPKDKPRAAEPSNAVDPGAWQVVTNRKAKKKTAPRRLQ